MAYEYERINNIGCVTSAISTDQAVEELKEVYRKAKAWDNYIVEVKDRVRFTENTKEDVENETQKVIDYYMEDE